MEHNEQDTPTQETSTVKNITKINGILLLKNFYFIFSVVIVLALFLGWVKFTSTTPPTRIEYFFLNFTEPFVMGISVSLIFMYMQNKFQASTFSNAEVKYEDVLSVVDMLQNARKNNGLVGITEAFSEKERFEELASRIYAKKSMPEVWWMNFRIRDYSAFATYIGDFVKLGGKVTLVTTHYDNPNIEFRREEAYGQVDVRDYKREFLSQARRFISLEEELKDSDGEFKVFFNKGTPNIPIFIEAHDLDYRAFSGFYLNDKSGDLPYVTWETAGRGMVRRFKEYIEYKMVNSLTAEEMLLDPKVSRDDAVSDNDPS